MKNKTQLIFLFSLTLFACKFETKQVIPVEKSTPQLVVFAELPNEAQIANAVYVVRTRNVGEDIDWDFNYGDSIKISDSTFFLNQGYNSFDTVKGTKVQLLEGDKVLRNFFTVVPGSGGIGYVSKDNIPQYKKNVEYTLKVSAPGFDTVIGKQVVTNTVQIKKMEVKRNSYNSVKDGNLSELLIEFDDPEAEKNVYRVDVAKAKLAKIGKEAVVERLTTYKIDPNAYNDKVVTDRFFNGKTYTWRVGINLNIPADKLIAKDSVAVYVYLTTAPPDYENYVRNKDARETASKSSFAEPISPYTNLKGGKGYFIFSGRSFQSLDIGK